MYAATSTRRAQNNVLKSIYETQKRHGAITFALQIAYILMIETQHNASEAWVTYMVSGTNASRNRWEDAEIQARCAIQRYNAELDKAEQS